MPGSERVLQCQLDLVHAADPAVERLRGAGRRIVQPVVERERRDRLAQRACVAPGLAQRPLIGERGAERRQPDLAPVLVQEVEEVEEVELQRELVPPVLRDRLPEGDVEPVLGGAAAAVALHDVAALLARHGWASMNRLNACAAATFWT